MADLRLPALYRLKGRSLGVYRFQIGRFRRKVESSPSPPSQALTGVVAHAHLKPCASLLHVAFHRVRTHLSPLVEFIGCRCLVAEPTPPLLPTTIETSASCSPLPHFRTDAFSIRHFGLASASCRAGCCLHSLPIAHGSRREGEKRREEKQQRR
ncbi:hypothetical protein Dimus_029043 [Dionaea muscipula]